MIIKLTCPEHPRYKGVYQPRATMRHSAGCECCWWLYHHRFSNAVTVVGQFKHSLPVMKVVRA